VTTFADRGVSCGQSGGTPTAVNFRFLDRCRYTFFQVTPHLCSRESEWTPFQAHCYSEHLVAPGIEPGTIATVARISDTEAVMTRRKEERKVER
jgi:hypothetical protein